jgi:excinuclease ABC subunit B
MVAEDDVAYGTKNLVSAKTLTIPQLEKQIQQIKKQMEKAAKDMDFIEAARLRDEMFRLQNELKTMRFS